MREIKIDLNGERYAVIRNFLKNRDRARLSRESLAGQKITQADIENNRGELTFDLGELAKTAEIQIEILLLDYNGEREMPFDALMDSEYADDYEAIREACAKVFEQDREESKK